MSKAKKFLEKVSTNKSVNEGSILEFPDMAKENKEFKKLFKKEEEIQKKREEISDSLLKMEDLLNDAQKQANKMKESDFPEGPKSAEGKEGYIDRIKFKLRDLDKAMDYLREQGLM